MDFLSIGTRSPKKGVIEIYPRFRITQSKDLMIRGRDFYAIWDEENNKWSTSEQDAINLIDKELERYAEENENKFNDTFVKVSYLWDAESGMIDVWHKYVQKQMRDNYNILDETLVFSNQISKRKDYSSKHLDYPLEKGNYDAWDKIIGTLYSPEERHKIEWTIGAIVTGASKKLQKFVVLYGSAGTGKSTILNIIQMLFKGYYATFDAKALGSTSNAFALEPFKENPLVGIQHDGDLSRIEDNTRLNSLVSHELMTVNEKFKATYATAFKTFLFMGTNRPVKITDGKSGLLRRLIDVTPSGVKLSHEDYDKYMGQVKFELGAIAWHCKEVFEEHPNYYDKYVPLSMMSASNDFYNFIFDSFFEFKKSDGVTLKTAWSMYNEYNEEAKVMYPYTKRVFKEELKNYFWNYDERTTLEDGTRVRNYYSNFRTDKMTSEVCVDQPKKEVQTIELDNIKSLLDSEFANYPAQYATDSGLPRHKWANIDTKLKDIDTSQLHYVRPPENLIVIDFDIQDENENKSLERNLIEASKFPKTYTEVSKSGKGIHLHYYYTGDVSKLSHIYDEHIEVKTFNVGNSALRRKLVKCNNIPIQTISSGLPLKEEKKVIGKKVIKSEKSLRLMILRNLDKEFCPGTKPSMDFIKKILDDAYESGLNYDVSDMKQKVIKFAMGSTHQSDYCLKLIPQIKWHSDNPSHAVETEYDQIVFYDIECFPNLFLVNWKKAEKDATLDDFISGKVQREGNKVVRWINPKPHQIEELLKYKLIGFNNRSYDNHMIYGCMMGYNNQELYNLSQRIVDNNKNAKFGEAYNLSYTDVYDFSSAVNKKSLKKWEIELGIPHHELGLPWDKPVPESDWHKVAEYCDDDVYATEATFIHLRADWIARQILADLADMTPNDSTNSLSTRIIFGNNRKPQNEFRYRDMSRPCNDLNQEEYDFIKEACPDMMSQTHQGPLGESQLPYFPKYIRKGGKSYWGDEAITEGGYIYTEPGVYGNVALLDITSQHPHSGIAECIFGPRYTKRFRELVLSRIAIKHKDFDNARKMLNGLLSPYIDRLLNGEFTNKDLANALKTVINSIYGLTDTPYPNPFRDERNVDNMMCKRGALFMLTLRDEVQKRGFKVAHIKTDSIKIPDATPEIIKFVCELGKKYGYTFEHEATYDRMALVNKAVYIAKYASKEKCEELYGYVPDECKEHGGQWTATGTQFAVPYVFKSLFSKEDIEFDDMCEIKSVKGEMHLDMNEHLEDVSTYEKELAKLDRDYKKGLINEFQYITESGMLKDKINKGHNYKFVGKIGQFCPIKPGCNGGLLMRYAGGKYYAVTGSKGYRWLESSTVKELDKADDIDVSYYDNLCEDAIKTINNAGYRMMNFPRSPNTDMTAFEWLVSPGDYIDTAYFKPTFQLECIPNKDYVIFGEDWEQVKEYPVYEYDETV